ncbi:hypothetical protein [Aeropyrum pernix]|nr:hypothetical protein [Aeropyrum pernix]
MGESLLSDMLKRDNMDLWSLLPSHPFVKALYSGSVSPLTALLIAFR